MPGLPGLCGSLRRRGRRAGSRPSRGGASSDAASATCFCAEVQPQQLRQRGACVTPIAVAAPARPLCSRTGSAGVFKVGRQPRAEGVLPHCEDPIVRAGAVRRRPLRERGLAAPGQALRQSARAGLGCPR